MDHKALALAYKESRRPMGVYWVRNLQSGHALIGRSTDLPAILNRERTSLWRERMQPDGAGNYAARQIAGNSTEPA